jgi:hypothetical protein
MRNSEKGAGGPGRGVGAPAARALLAPAAIAAQQTALRRDGIAWETLARHARLQKRSAPQPSAFANLNFAEHDRAALASRAAAESAPRM